MPAYLFSASSTSPSLFSDSIENLDDSCDDYFTVVLSESDFSIFLDLLGLSGAIENKLTSSQDFKSIFDLSSLEIPELSLEEFNTFYEVWLKKVGRESSMDEYGQLIFIQGYAVSWNLKKYRFVLVENS